MNFLDQIWLIPLFPLAGAILMLLVGRFLDPQSHSRDALAPNLAPAAGDPHGAGHDHGHAHAAPKSKLLVSLLCPGMVLLSLIFSLGAVIQLARLPEPVHEVVQFRWLAALPFHMLNGQTATLQADWGFLLDPLSAVMMLVVTGVSFVIHVYSIGYMAHDGGYYRFFGYMNLFVFFMLMLVMANNYALLFVGWEGVGLCSYLLIGFYFHKKSAGDAGKKAFIVNRIGDSGFVLGMLLMLMVFGSFRFLDVNRLAQGATQYAGLIGGMTLLMFAGATGKSAQIPLYVWLPDAMEGPTPVSALIHAATMVTAGVYMVARSHVLFAQAAFTSEVVAVVGACTALLAATIALQQNDIKRVLAYSTVSQLGYMFLALGVGAYWVAIFHLFTHAFFKALLFLGSGSVIHALSGEQDMRYMGALRKKIPITHLTMLVATLAITGIPGFAGFFSKDEILAQVYGAGHGSHLLYWVGLVTAGLTAFYMWRLMYMTFYGSSRVKAEHVRESPAVMTGPLAVLALGSIVGGWIGLPAAWSAFGPGFRFFEHWLEPALGRRELHEIPEWSLMALSVGIALVGWWIASRLYMKQGTGWLANALRNKWYVDEIYDFLFVNGLAKGGGSMLASFDRNVVDGGVNGTGWMTRFTSTVSIWWDTWIVDGTVRLTSFLVKMSSYPVRLAQSGYVQSYALIFVMGVLAVLAFYVTR